MIFLHQKVHIGRTHVYFNILVHELYQNKQVRGTTLEVYCTLRVTSGQLSACDLSRNALYVSNYRQWAINVLKLNEREGLFTKPLLLSLALTRKSLWKNWRTIQKLLRSWRKLVVMGLRALQQTSRFHSSKQEFSVPGPCPPAASRCVSLGLQRVIRPFRGVYKNPNLSSSPPNWIYVILVAAGKVLKGTKRRKVPFSVCF